MNRSVARLGFLRFVGLPFLLLVPSSAPPGLAAEPSGVPAPPPVPVSVAAVVDDVLTRNPELRFYVAELAAARGERRTVGQWANPEVSPQVARKRSTDAVGALQGEGMAWTVSVSQTFEWPGRLALRKSIANRQVALAETGLAQFKAALAARARTLACGLAMAQQQAEAIQAVADRFLALQEIAVQRDPAGVTPLLEARILEANSITYRRRAAEALQASREAQLELNQLRGESLGARVQVAPVRWAFQPIPGMEPLLALARTNNFELRQRVLELEQQGFRVDLARNERYPAVTVSPYYTEENAGGKDRFAGVGISLPLPLWNRNQGNLDTAAARESQARTAVQVAQQSVERRLREWVASYESRLEEMSHWRVDSVERFREAAELADRHYRLGAVPIATYVEMQKQSLEALEALWQTRREAMESAQQLELATGTPLGLVVLEPVAAQP
jgi:cobalt-zinc-cadmium efflux system outer membrane protein